MNQERRDFLRPANFIDITGMKFNRLTAIEYAGQGSCGARWKFKCDCGNEIVTSSYPVRNGKTKSCGCWNNENKHNRYRIHGMHKTKLYSAWTHMKQRCLNPKCASYKDYGGRGISICSEWVDDFTSFRDWAYENGYSEELTLDRIDNNKGYYPENCRWVSMETQENNKRNNHFYLYKGEKKTLSQIANENKISRNSLYYRVNVKNVPLGEAVETLKSMGT